MTFFRQRIVFIFLAIVVFSAVFGAGVFVGAKRAPEITKITGIENRQTPASLILSATSTIDFNPFWKAWNILEEKYVSSEGIDRQDMIWGAISGMAKSLNDPYTVFLPPKENEYFESEIRGDFEGVGMEIGMRKDRLTVIAPLKGTPAYEAGIKAGDKVIEIDGKSTFELTLDEAVNLIRGPKGSEVVLTILRNGEDETRKIAIVRDVIKIPIIETEEKENGIFVIRLFNFSGPSVIEFRKALRKMVDSGSDKLILDLRNNPGGFLEAAVDVSSWFLPAGKPVAIESFGGSRDEIVHRSRGYDIFNDNLKMVILVNKGSASASEIVAGALRDHGIAIIVGEKTFGKGSVQELVPITDNTSLKVTIARWLTPSRHSISENGLEPDVVVEIPENIEETDILDPFMDKAIEVISNQ